MFSHFLSSFVANKLASLGVSTALVLGGGAAAEANRRSDGLGLSLVEPGRQAPASFLHFWVFRATIGLFHAEERGFDPTVGSCQRSSPCGVGLPGK